MKEHIIKTNDGEIHVLEFSYDNGQRAWTIDKGFVKLIGYVDSSGNMTSDVKGDDVLVKHYIDHREDYLDFAAEIDSNRIAHISFDAKNYRNHDDSYDTGVIFIGDDHIPVPAINKRADFVLSLTNDKGESMSSQLEQGAYDYITALVTLTGSSDYTMIMDKQLRLVKVLHGRFDGSGIFVKRGITYSFDWNTLSIRDKENEAFSVTLSKSSDGKRTVLMKDNPNNEDTCLANVFDECGNKIFDKDLVVGLPKYSNKCGIVTQRGCDTYFYIFPSSTEYDKYDIITEKKTVVRGCYYKYDDVFVIPNRCDDMGHTCDVHITLFNGNNGSYGRNDNNNRAVTSVQYVYANGSQFSVYRDTLLTIINRRRF